MSLEPTLTFLLQMRYLVFSWFAVVALQCVLVTCQQDLPLWSGQAISKELLRPYFLDAASSSIESPDYDSSQKSPALSSAYPARQSVGGLKKRVGEFILHINLLIVVVGYVPVQKPQGPSTNYEISYW